MRNLIITFLICGFMLPVSAQRFGYVDTGFILENLPSYQQAETTLQNQTRQWNQEIQNRQDALDKRRADFLNEKVLLTEEQIKKEEEEIDEEQKTIQALQEQRYGQNGDLINLRRTVVQPIQDQVWTAVKQVAERRNYGFIFDKGSDLIMVYTDPKFDISMEVLRVLNPDAADAASQKNRQGSSAGNKNTNTRGRTSTPPSKGSKSGGVKNDRTRTDSGQKTSTKSLKR